MPVFLRRIFIIIVYFGGVIALRNSRPKYFGGWCWLNESNPLRAPLIAILFHNSTSSSTSSSYVTHVVFPSRVVGGFASWRRPCFDSFVDVLLQ